VSLRSSLRVAQLTASFLALVALGPACSPEVATGARPSGDAGATSTGGASTTTGGGISTGTGGSGVVNGAGSGGVVGGAGSVAGSVGSGGVVSSGGVTNNGGTGGGPKVLGPGNRCELAGVTVAKGTTLLVDDVEDDDFKVLPADGRDASWYENHDASPGAMASFKIEPTTPGAPGTTKAMHYHVSGLDDWGAVVGLPFNLCYDASAYAGFSFWIKGAQTTGGTDQVLLALHTPVSEPEASGGACKDLPNCYNHFSADVFTVPTTWTFLNGGFGDTIKQINGALECGGKNPGAVSNRQQRFRSFCAALGVAPGAKDTGC